MADTKQTVSQMAKQLREEYEIDPGRSDADVVSSYLKKHPEGLERLQTSQPRPGGRPAPEDEPKEGFVQGVTATIPEAVQGLTSTAFGQARRQKDLMATKGWFKGAAQSSLEQAVIDPLKGIGHMATHPGSLVDMPNITKDIKKGDWGGAIGRSIPPALMIGGMAKGMIGGLGRGAAGAELEEMSAIGEGTGSTRAAAAMDAAKLATKPIDMHLTKQMEAIDAAMEHEYINTQRLTAGIASAKKALAKVAKSPGTTAGDLTAAQDAVSRLDKAITGKKTMGWTDARKALQEMNAAKSKMGPSVARNALQENIDALKIELKDSAKAAGQGDVYDAWVKDYRQMSNLQRAYKKSLLEQTGPQMATKATAKSAPAIRVLGSKLPLGKSRLGKITSMNKEMLDKTTKAISQLGENVRGRTLAKPRAQGPLSESGTFVRPEPKPGFGTSPGNVPIEERQPPPVSGGSGKPPEPQWPANYQAGPKPGQAGFGGTGAGANYTEEMLKAFKDKHPEIFGIKPPEK